MKEIKNSNRTGVAELNEDFLRSFIVVDSIVASELPLNDVLIGDEFFVLVVDVDAAPPVVIRIGGEAGDDSTAVVVVVVLELWFSLVGMLRFGLSKLMANKIDCRPDKSIGNVDE